MNTYTAGAIMTTDNKYTNTDATMFFPNYDLHKIVIYKILSSIISLVK